MKSYFDYKSNLFYVFIGSIILFLLSYSVNAQNIKECPRDMLPVRVDRSKICVDIYEYSENNVPVGFLNRHDCKDICESQNKRLLNHQEWKEAGKGTKARSCNIFRPHPIYQMLERNSWIVKNNYGNTINCKLGNNAFTWPCMNDPILNQLPNSLSDNGEFPNCVSQYGMKNMIGNLGEWVSTPGKHPHLGRFNGGLYSQRKSHLHYTTVVHGPEYSDYSLGCRCARD